LSNRIKTTSVEYSYSIPLEFPQLYSLGPLEIQYSSNNFTEARPWFVAADPLPISSLTLDVKKGTFLRQDDPGLQSVNVGFKPKVVIFWGTNKVTEGFSADASHFQGFMASATEQRAIASFGNDGGAGHKIDNKAIVIIKNNAPDVAADADFVSFDRDGFTIDWTKNDGVNNIIHYQAIGGSDLTDIKVGHFVGEEGVEEQMIRGVGFTPKFVLFMNPYVELEEIGGDLGIEQVAGFGYGMATSREEQGTLSMAHSG